MTHIKHRKPVYHHCLGYNFVNGERYDRIIVERELERSLDKHELVHHVNFCPWDDRPQNLAVVTQRI